jgi:hypothetical protein
MQDAIAFGVGMNDSMRLQEKETPMWSRLSRKIIMHRSYIPLIVAAQNDKANVTWTIIGHINEV